jgi:hypothetical protein
VETEFVIEEYHFKLLDVGGQRNERKKWIHCFENVTSIIFVAALNEFDQLLFEDNVTNRLHEALNLFSEIINSRWFAFVASLFLFLSLFPALSFISLSLPFLSFSGSDTSLSFFS